MVYMGKENEIKIFRIKGEYVKNFQKFTFVKEKRALKKEHAIEDVLSEVSSVGIYRRKVKITDVKEIQPNEVQDPFIMALLEKQ